MASGDRPLRVGVVGASIAHSVDQRQNLAIRTHLPALLAPGDWYEVAAVCTMRMESAREAACHVYFEMPEHLTHLSGSAGAPW